MKTEIHVVPKLGIHRNWFYYNELIEYLTISDR